MTDAEAWDERYAGHKLVWSAEPNQFVAAEVGPPPHPGATALDVACGEGRNAVWLAEQGWHVTAVDFSTVAVAKARGLAQHRGVSVEWVVDDVTAWEPPHSFDLVVVAYLQLPPEQLDAALAHTVAGVAAGGRLVAVGHHVDNLADGYGGPPDLSLLWDPDWIAARLDGLTLIRADRVDRVVTTDGGPRTALDALIVAERRSPSHEVVG